MRNLSLQPIGYACSSHNGDSAACAHRLTVTLTGNTAFGTRVTRLCWYDGGANQCRSSTLTTAYPELGGTLTCDHCSYMQEWWPSDQYLNARIGAGTVPLGDAPCTGVSGVDGSVGAGFTANCAVVDQKLNGARWCASV